MKIERIVFATGNAGKIREIQAILADLGLEVASMSSWKEVSSQDPKKRGDT